MVQRCWNKGPLGPSIPWGGFVLLYTNDPSDPLALELIEAFGAKIVEVSEVVSLDPDAVNLPFKYAVVWKW
ncbi:hypothetical protein EYM_02035 [Ignicoccus islandicus DSM 13165]|uniref:Uncharacterized protein n=1 Tax=Ignicoccus islandicus DSM 13165 TaxID=940295 RepID=A0A0U3F404_9CREN|nr:hypothetical protein [Ignicoccus islandicus]ALU12277.1 hypothetical protein EYM_02035 [Ignicoccus islandicus DSM 13165]